MDCHRSHRGVAVLLIQVFKYEVLRATENMIGGHGEVSTKYNKIMYSNNPAPSRLASILAAQVLATLAPPSMLRTLPRARPCQAVLPSGVFGRCQHQCRLGCQDPSSQKTSIQNHFHVTLAQCGTAWH